MKELFEHLMNRTVQQELEDDYTNYMIECGECTIGELTFGFSHKNMCIERENFSDLFLDSKVISFEHRVNGLFVSTLNVPYNITENEFNENFKHYTYFEFTDIEYLKRVRRQYEQYIFE